MMSVAAARALRDGQACFVGIGLPSTAANLARRLHAPDLVLIYESGTLGTRPDQLPLSIGDGVLAESALTVVSVPEIFNYWLQPGRIDVGFLSGAQVDRFGNINTTVIGEYDEPDVRLPGAGGAPEIAASCREVIVVMRHQHARVRRAGRLRHLRRPRQWPAATAQLLGPARPRPDPGDHRPRRARARPGRQRAGAHGPCITASPSRRCGRRRAGSCRCRPT